MKKTVICIIARTVSTRLPLKIFRTVNEQHETMLDYLITRMKKVPGAAAVYLCTSSEPVDEIMEDVAAKNGIGIYRGSANNVIERMLAVGEKEKADYLVRVTGDNVLTSYEYIDRLIEIAGEHELDYARMVDVPLGTTAEVIRKTALERCMTMMDPDISEYLMLFIFRPDIFRCGVLRISGEDLSSYSLTVDTPNDLQRTREIFRYYAGDPHSIRMEDAVRIIREHAIPFSTLVSGGPIKLPHGKVMSAEEFNADMEERKKKSQLFLLT